ncbi:unnamed protein product [Discosporangium mesarthrocarpum]
MMLVFASLSMGSFAFSHPSSMVVYSRVLLTLGGISIIGLSTVAALGFVSFLGLPLTPISVNIVPFLSLGIGIDDMFILTYGLVQATSFRNEPVQRVSKTLASSGPSVLLTSLANSGCFLVAAVIPINTVRFFAIHMGIQMIFHGLALHLMFVPMMYWDSLRVDSSRADVFPMKIDPDRVVPEEEFGKINGTAKFIREVYGPLLRSRLFKVLTVVSAVAMTALLTWYGVRENELGVGLNTMAEEGTHLESFLHIFEDTYTASSVYLVTKDVDLAEHQQNLLDLQDAAQQVKWVSSVSTIKDNSWLADSATSLLGSSAEVLPVETFNFTFQAWIQGVGTTSDQSFYCQDGDNGPRVDCAEFVADETVVKASLQTVYLTDQSSRSNQVRTINDMREALDAVDPSRNTYAYGDSFALHSQYLYTWENFAWVMGAGSACVVVVVTLLEGSLLLSLLICLSIVMVVLQVFGVLVLLEVHMNGFSIVNLCIMIGMVVEFTAHIGRGFLLASGTKDERVEETLVELLWPTFAGACTTFLAVLPLTFSEITFFHNYYFQTFAVMTAFGFLTGSCFLPVLLSVAGPTALSIGQDLDKTHGNEDHAVDLPRTPSPEDTLANPMHSDYKAGIFQPSQPGQKRTSTAAVGQGVKSTARV